jgi:putative aldouronate transport system permease protein
MGWSAIIYLAALANVDPQLYEAASIDGANRFQQMKNITIPGIMGIVVIQLILAIGHLLSVGGQKILLLYNPMTYSTADVVSTMVYRLGIEGTNYSLATAIGLFESIIGLVMVWGANQFARKFSDSSLW